MLSERARLQGLYIPACSFRELWFSIIYNISLTYYIYVYIYCYIHTYNEMVLLRATNSLFELLWQTEATALASASSLLIVGESCHYRHSQVELHQHHRDSPLVDVAQ